MQSTKYASAGFTKREGIDSEIPMKEDKKIKITPKQKEMLKKELTARMKIRNRHSAERQSRFFK